MELSNVITCASMVPVHGRHLTLLQSEVSMLHMIMWLWEKLVFAMFFSCFFCRAIRLVWFRHCCLCRASTHCFKLGLVRGFRWLWADRLLLYFRWCRSSMITMTRLFHLSRRFVYFKTYRLRFQLLVYFMTSL